MSQTKSKPSLTGRNKIETNWPKSAQITPKPSQTKPNWVKMRKTEKNYQCENLTLPEMTNLLKNIDEWMHTGNITLPPPPPPLLPKFTPPSEIIS